MSSPNTIAVLTLALAMVSVSWGCLDDSPRPVTSVPAPPPPPPPPAPPWPNEPANFVLIDDYGFADSVPATPEALLLGRSDWWVVRNPISNGSRAPDDGAPLSPPFVYQVRYPVGFTSGSTPSTLQHYLRAPYPRELYWGFWWKPSSPFQSDASGVNKIVFLWTQTALGASADLLYFSLSPSPWRIQCADDLLAGGGPRANSRLEPNVDTTIVTLGAWHRIEIYAKYSTADSANGVVRWWVNGQLNGEYTDLKMVQDSGFKYLQVAPTYGGNTGDIKHQTDYFWFDHSHVSRAP